MSAGARIRRAARVQPAWLWALLVAAALAVAALWAVLPAQPAFAESGTIYSCTIVPSYRNPVTGEVEDSGGESSYATGQGMVESCISTQGMLEVTDAGSNFLTIRLGLMDYTSGHTIQVQEWGASGWSNPRLAVTGSGSDGSTQDVCVEVPSSQCVLRVSMYVEPMGRDVICFCYPKDFKAGQPSSMTPAVVTEDSQAAQAAAAAAAAAEAEAAAAAAASAAAETAAPAETAAQADAPAVETQSPTAADTAAGDASIAPSDVASAAEAVASDETTGSDLTGQALDAAAGLSLSTADASAAQDSGVSDGATTVSLGYAPAAIATAGGLVVVAAAVAGLLLMRRNSAWFAAADPDDYDSLYGDDDD